MSLPRIARGEGSYLYDTTGRRYLDGSGGPAAFGIGHDNPEVHTTIASQRAGRMRIPISFQQRAAPVLPTNNIIVLKWHHNRDYNEVVEFSVLHEDIREFMFLRKSVCLMRSKFGGRAVPRF